MGFVYSPGGSAVGYS